MEWDGYVLFFVFFCRYRVKAREAFSSLHFRSVTRDSEKRTEHRYFNQVERVKSTLQSSRGTVTLINGVRWREWHIFPSHNNPMFHKTPPRETTVVSLALGKQINLRFPMVASAKRSGHHFSVNPIKRGTHKNISEGFRRKGKLEKKNAKCDFRFSWKFSLICNFNRFVRVT